MSKKRKIDRRYIFLLIFFGVAIPLIVPLGLHVETSPNVQMVYDLIENTQPGSKVLISFDYDPASKPELHPMGKAVLKHCFQKDIKVIITALWPMGVAMAQDILSQLQAEFPEAEYGKDYINMGFKAGAIVTIQAMGKNFRKVFPQDMNGTDIIEFKILEGVEDFSDFSFAFSLSAGAPGIKEWVMIAHDKYNLTTSGGTTAVTAPSILPYVNDLNQLTGLLGGLKAAAEYEQLIKSPGTATSGMDAQSIAHLIIIIFILIANINYWRNKKN